MDNKEGRQESWYTKKGRKESLDTKEGRQESLDTKEGGQESLDTKEGGQESWDTKEGGQKKLGTNEGRQEMDKEVEEETYNRREKLSLKNFQERCLKTLKIPSGFYYLALYDFPKRPNGKSERGPPQLGPYESGDPRGPPALHRS